MANWRNPQHVDNQQSFEARFRLSDRLRTIFSNDMDWLPEADVRLITGRLESDSSSGSIGAMRVPRRLHPLMREVAYDMVLSDESSGNFSAEAARHCLDWLNVRPFEVYAGGGEALTEASEPVGVDRA